MERSKWNVPNSGTFQNSKAIPRLRISERGHPEIFRRSFQGTFQILKRDDPDSGTFQNSGTFQILERSKILVQPWIPRLEVGTFQNQPRIPRLERSRGLERSRIPRLDPLGLQVCEGDQETFAQYLTGFRKVLSVLEPNLTSGKKNGVKKNRIKNPFILHQKS